MSRRNTMTTHANPPGQGHLSLGRLVLLALLLSVALTAACLVPPAGSVRGWKCEADSDCLNSTFCYEKKCRGKCQDDLDCVGQLGEVCDTSVGYCLPPPTDCTPGASRKCYDGPAGTVGKGPCKEGTQKCSSEGKWGKCENWVGPGDEGTNPCNEKDDDCDGQIDNGNRCDCKPGETQKCYGGVVGCTAQGGNFSCKGICATGVQTCGSNNKWGECKSWRGPADDETCNGEDDDCDGQVDDNVIDDNKTCSVPGQQGPCANGTSECNMQAGKLECKSSYRPFEEDCNGKDDDCDGGIDNFKGTASIIFKECITTNPGCKSDGAGGFTCMGTCASGKQKCLSNQKTWATACDDEVRPAKQEQCDGKDEDCNGMIDDNTIEEGQDCPDSGELGECKAGAKACENGNVVCKPKKTPTAKDACDGKDNDCDGQTDEGPDACPSGQTCNNGSCQ